MILKDRLISEFKNLLKTEYGKTIEDAQDYELWDTLSKAIMGMISNRWYDTNQKYSEEKQACYFSAEFLMGRALGNNLLNLGIYKDVKEILEEINIDLNQIEEAEQDAGLGNGGLGRLAACFMDSCATMNLPVTGYGIRYEYGLFKQKFSNGFQIEEADNWTKYGDPWSRRCSEDTVIVHFNKDSIKAVPYDTPIIGYDTDNINTLRLWKAEPIVEFDFSLFDQQKYDDAVREKNRAEDISRVLYPNDMNREGKELRFKQQYFFVSASIQDLVKKYKSKFGDNFDSFADHYAIQLNDTHPVVAIPELLRILIDHMNMPWEKAWEIAINTFSYTNHTILAEALEKWEIDLVRSLLPRIYEIIETIDSKLDGKLRLLGYEQSKIERMKILNQGQVHMAWLAVEGSHTINGVAKIHSDILKYQELNDWYQLYPNKFQNKTNGITPRRWLALCNMELSSYITRLLGNERWITNLGDLKQLKKYSNNQEVLKNFREIKRMKKKQLADYIQEKEGISIDIESIFDIQIKRLHEYKRQLLKAFHILDLYYILKENPNMDFLPKTFIFGAKAATGYFRAKAIIKFINDIATLINNDPDLNDKIKVVFIQNYGVSYGEKLFPAADLSEQISTPGKEASGTGNMKFMLNGTPTIGTLDGANIEIVQEAGRENNFIFGSPIDELEKMKDSYNPKECYENVPGLKRVVDSLIDGSFDDSGTGMYKELYHSLLSTNGWGQADNFYILKDFEAYRDAQNKVTEAYKNKNEWAKKCWLNMCYAGKFSSDRTIGEYAKEIWHVKPQSL